MRSMRPVLLTCAAVLAWLTVAPAAAQPFDKRTTFTFNAPVSVPGVTLPAGSYVFRIANPGVSQRVIQVVSADGTKPYAMFFSIPAERLEPAKDPEVRFMETAAGMPTAIQTWWYPGDRIGYEFVYPKDQARKLAQGAAQPVLTTRAETTTVEQTNTSELARLSSTGQETNVSPNAPPTPAAPTGISQQGQIAPATVSIPTPNVPAQAATASSTPTAQATATTGQQPASGQQRTGAARTRLPQTGSPVPTLTLVGLLSLGSAAALRAWRVR